MKLIDGIIICVLLIGFGGTLFFLWKNVPVESEQYREFIANISQTAPAKSVQFYPNMRYRDKTIPYSISDNCTRQKKDSVEESFRILEAQTPLKFVDQSPPQLLILCSELTNEEPEEEGHFIAGEGGPTQVINASSFAVILSGRVSLFREEKCPTPHVALHEILHALGFDHNKNKTSILYPVTECEQQLDMYITDEITRLYTVDSLPDMTIESIKANRTGRELSFEIVISNQGLKAVENVELVLSSDDKKISSHDLGKFEIGTKKKYTVTRERIPATTDILEFSVRSNTAELQTDNNRASLRITPEANR